VQKEKKKVYTPPSCVKLGSFVKSTLGSAYEDTADKKNYYY